MELEESTCLTSGSTTKPQSSRQYGTGTKTDLSIETLQAKKEWQDIFKVMKKKNIGKTLSDTNHSRILYDPPPIVVEIKTKLNK